MEFRAILVSLALLAFASPARAMNWSLGANLVGSPGLRLGFQGENPQHQFYVDSGVFFISSSGSSLTTVQFTGNYQYSFTGGGSTHPYLTGGVGMVNFSSNDFFFGDGSVMSPVFGAGVGVAHRLGHGHGTVRAEIRVDRVIEGEDDGAPVIPASNNIGLKLGFDLWMK